MSTLQLHSSPTSSSSFAPITTSRFFQTSRVSLRNAVVTLQSDISSVIGEREADRQRVCRQRKRDSELRRGIERSDW
ncbi:uncharacterized protein HKW66_Vig0084190 [Vigna angularis]|uniref:Uncharacterized protein n=1 Tax=Phaseolus angularis TaxID=3914 RepID=A0A8T0KJ00_PHAAN|nr:uncharacterized protein HKW66_Vig0084190 [Vigna angularis]